MKNPVAEILQILLAGQESASESPAIMEEV
jgi:hypothetical protein